MQNIITIILICLITIACSNESVNVEIIDDAEVIPQEELDDEYEAYHDETPIVSTSVESDLSTIISELEIIDFPIEWNAEKLDNFSWENHKSISWEDFKSWNWNHENFEYYAGDSVDFKWKKIEENYTLLCFTTFEMFAKGGSTEYYIASVTENIMDGEFYPIDIVNIAASRAISTENPNGGTSAGIEYQYGYINEKGTLLTTSLNGDSTQFNISEAGKFDLVSKEQSHINH